MAFKKDSVPEKAPIPERAIFAVREVLLRGNLIINQERGMACAVAVEGKKYLLTWHGVVNEKDQDKPIKFFNDQQDYHLEMSAINQIGNCSFISLKSVERGEDAHTPNKDILKTFNTLKLNVPESDERIKDVYAHSFIGCKDFVAVKFKYNENEGEHELDSVEKLKKKWNQLMLKRETGKKFEKSAILGAPIVTAKNNVIGVVRDDSYGQLRPYFITKTEFGHEEIKDPGENGTDAVKGKGRGCALDTLDASGITEELINLKSIKDLKDTISKSKVESKGVPKLTEELSGAVSDMGLFVHDNEGRGNCLFHALSQQLEFVKKISVGPDELRKTLVNYLEEHPKMRDGTPLSSLLESNEQSSCAWDKYLKDMAKDGTWGDQITIFAAANYYKTIIIVIRALSEAPNGRLEIPFKPECEVKGDNPIWLGHIYDCHFVSLLKAPEPPSDPPIIWTQQEVLKDKLGKCVSGKNVL